MKLPLPSILFLFARTTGELLSRHRRTLSATAKKPASLAGFLYLILRNTRLARPFPAPALCSPHLSFTQLAYSNSK